MNLTVQEAKDFGATHSTTTISGNTKFLKRGKDGRWVVLTTGERGSKRWEEIYYKMLMSLPEKLV